MIAPSVDKRLRDLEGKTTGVINVRAFPFLAKGDGITDDRAAVVAAIGSSVDRHVFFPKGTYLISSAISLTSANGGLKLVGQGSAVSHIKKGFSGDLITFADTSYVEVRGIHFLGQHGTYTGKGLVFSGQNSDYPTITDCVFEAFTGPALEFGADAGYSAQVSRIRSILGTGQTDVEVIHLGGNDTGPAFRLFSQVELSRGYFKLVGAANTHIVNSVFHRVENDANSVQLYVLGCEWANEDMTTMTIYGTTTHIIGCRFAGDVVLDSTFSGSFLGNSQTSGTFTDNSPAGNLIFYKTNGGTWYLGKNTLRAASSGSDRVVSARLGNIPTDGDVALTVNGNFPTTRLTGTLTAARTCTLSTTAAVNGDRFRIVRTGGGAFNWNVGPGLKTLTAASQWADFEYDGAAWVLTGYGAL